VGLLPTPGTSISNVSEEKPPQAPSSSQGEVQHQANKVFTMPDQCITDPVQIYSFESESQHFQISRKSDQGREFEALIDVAEKIAYLEANGKETTKQLGARIMIPQPGVWCHCNVGQLEYMVPAESDAGERYCKVNGIEEKVAFWDKNVTRIREWPKRIARSQDFQDNKGKRAAESLMGVVCWTAVFSSTKYQ